MENQEFIDQERVNYQEKVNSAKQQLDELLEKGVQIKVPRRGLNRLLHKNKDQVYTIPELHTGTIIRLASVFLEMNIDEKAIAEDPLGESKRLSKDGLKLMAKALAIAILGNSPARFMKTDRLTNDLLWRLKPSNLIEFAMVLNSMCNYGDFLNSFRLMSAAVKAASPVLKEQNLKD